MGLYYTNPPPPYCMHVLKELRYIYLFRGRSSNICSDSCPQTINNPDVTELLLGILAAYLQANNTATPDHLFCSMTLRTKATTTIKGGHTLVTLPRIVTTYRDSVDGTRDSVTYQKLVTR